MPQWRGSLHHIIVSDISLKTRSLDYIPVTEILGISPTTFTQCALNATDFAEITKIMATTPFMVIQGRRFWYQSKAHATFLLVINSNLITSYLAPFPRYSLRYV